MAEDVKHKMSRNARKSADIGRILVKEEMKARAKRINSILKKNEGDRATAEITILEQSPDIVKSILKRSKHRALAKHRQLEIEDSPDNLEAGCTQLAEALSQSTSVVVFTGAGISTAASIPDYRGPNGVWTLLQQGIQPEAQNISDAEPTLTHMSIAELYKAGVVKHVVSQNCDGLHIRSGLPREVLSELHGNMYIEMCTNCESRQNYIRLFDVTERTGVRRHKTGRHCRVCKEELRDTIVHFGEKSVSLGMPYNWQRAADIVDKADVVLCLGSSLKVLKKYPCLWSVHKPINKRPKLFIVNLQWTPKDEVATLKINGRCDDVMVKVMEHMSLPLNPYKKECDHIYHIHNVVLPGEEDIASKPCLVCPQNLQPYVRLTPPKSASDLCSTPDGNASKTYRDNYLCNGKMDAETRVSCNGLNGEDVHRNRLVNAQALPESIERASQLAASGMLPYAALQQIIDKCIQRNLVDHNYSCAPQESRASGPSSSTAQYQGGRCAPKMVCSNVQKDQQEDVKGPDNPTLRSMLAANEARASKTDGARSLQTSKENLCNARVNGKCQMPVNVDMASGSTQVPYFGGPLLNPFWGGFFPDMAPNMATNMFLTGLPGYPTVPWMYPMMQPIYPMMVPQGFRPVPHISPLHRKKPTVQTRLEPSGNNVVDSALPSPKELTCMVKRTLEEPVQDPPIVPVKDRTTERDSGSINTAGRSSLEASQSIKSEDSSVKTTNSGKPEMVPADKRSQQKDDCGMAVPCSNACWGDKAVFSATSEDPGDTASSCQSSASSDCESSSRKDYNPTSPQDGSSITSNNDLKSVQKRAAPTTTAPGWFGKGLSIKKYKRRK